MTKFGMKLIIFVTGSSAGFPCMYDLSTRLVEDGSDHPDSNGNNDNGTDLELAHNKNGGCAAETTSLLHQTNNSMNNAMAIKDFIMEDEERPMTAYPHNPRRSSSFNPFNTINELPTQFLFSDAIVCESLDRALIFAEDALIALVNPELIGTRSSSNRNAMKQETDKAFEMLKYQCHGEDLVQVRKLFDLMEREVWMKDDVLWKENDTSTSLKLIVSGKLVSIIDNDPDASEGIHVGAIFGELGLVSNSHRLTTVKCDMDHTILYSLNKEKWDKLVKEDPSLARCIDLIVVRYLAHRVQHVSNRIFETRCLPI